MTDRSSDIREAIIDLLADGGYHHASMRRLAERAGVAASAVYTYADSKEDLVFRVIDELMEGLLAETNMVLESLTDPEDRLRAFIYRLAYRTAAQHRESRILQIELRALSAGRREHIIASRDRYERILREILAGSDPSLDPDTPLVKSLALAILGMCTSISDWYRPEGGSMTPEEIGNFYAGLVIAMASAVLTPDGGDRPSVAAQPELTP